MNNQQLQGSTVFVDTDSFRFTNDGNLELEYSRAVNVSNLGENQRLLGPILENEVITGDIEEIVDIVVTLGDKETEVATFKDKIYWRIVTDSRSGGNSNGNGNGNGNGNPPPNDTTPSDCDILQEPISPNSTRMGDKKGLTEITCQGTTYEWDGQEWQAKQSSTPTYPAPANGNSHTVGEILKYNIPPSKIIGTYEDYRSVTLNGVPYSWDGQEWQEAKAKESCGKLERPGDEDGDIALCNNKTYYWYSRNDQSINNGWQELKQG